MSATKQNPADGSTHCSRSDICILGYGHRGRCVVDPADIYDAPDHAPGCGCHYCTEDYADVEDSSVFVSSMREAVAFWGEP